MTLTISDIIQLIGIIASLTTSIVAILISVKTMKQNSKMIEESTRAVIGIYSDTINCGSPSFYLIVKNFGNSVAIMTKFDSDFDFTDCLLFGDLSGLSSCVIAPGQSRISRLIYEKIERPITFNIEYLSSSKLYSDTLTIDLTANMQLIASKVPIDNKELRTISYALQEMVQKNL